jgi:hypothetical protein
MCHCPPPEARRAPEPAEHVAPDDQALALVLAVTWAWEPAASERALAA